MTRTNNRALANTPHNFVSVLDFGADPTGATDSYQAFADAIQFIQDNLITSSTPGRPSFIARTLYIPSGEYSVSQALDFRTYSISVKGEGVASTKVYFPNSNNCGFKFDEVNNNANSFGHTISDLSINGEPSGNNAQDALEEFTEEDGDSVGIRVNTYIRLCTFKNVHVYGFDIGLRGTTSWSTIYESCEFWNNAKYGCLLSNCGQTTWTTCRWENNGIGVKSTASETLKYFSCIFQANTFGGLRIKLRCDQIIFTGCYWEFNGRSMSVFSDSNNQEIGTQADINAASAVLDGSYWTMPGELPASTGVVVHGGSSIVNGAEVNGNNSKTAFRGYGDYQSITGCNFNTSFGYHPGTAKQTFVAGSTFSTGDGVGVRPQILHTGPVAFNPLYGKGVSKINYYGKITKSVSSFPNDTTEVTIRLYLGTGSSANNMCPIFKLVLAQGHGVASGSLNYKEVICYFRDTTRSSANLAIKTVIETQENGPLVVDNTNVVTTSGGNLGGYADITFPVFAGSGTSTANSMWAMIEGSSCMDLYILDADGNDYNTGEPPIPPIKPFSSFDNGDFKEITLDIPQSSYEEESN